MMDSPKATFLAAQFGDEKSPGLSQGLRAEALRGRVDDSALLVADLEHGVTPLAATVGEKAEQAVDAGEMPGGGFRGLGTRGEVNEPVAHVHGRARERAARNGLRPQGRRDDLVDDGRHGTRRADASRAQRTSISTTRPSPEQPLQGLSMRSPSPPQAGQVAGALPFELPLPLQSGHKS